MHVENEGCASRDKLATVGRAHPKRTDRCRTTKLIIDKSLKLGTGGGEREKLKRKEKAG